MACYEWGLGLKNNERWDNSSDTPKMSALYRYEDYLFIFRIGENRDLIIVNTKSNSIAVWSSSTNPVKVNTQLNYNLYYLSRIRACMFIHAKMGHVLLLDMISVDKILSQDNKCYKIENGIIKFFDLNSAISSFIHKYYHGSSVKMNNLIGHYVNRESGLLYIVASYNVDQIRHIGLFECKIIGNGINVNLIDFVSVNKIYNSKYCKSINVGNIELYKISETSLADLELGYGSNDKIISIGHNRQSVSLQNFLREQPIDYVIKQRNVFQYNKLIILEHVIREEFKLDYVIWFSFIVSELCLVDKWEA